MLDLVDVGAQKKSYKNHQDVEFQSLDFYIGLAKKTISKFADQMCYGLSKEMLKSEDAISGIANAIMMADWRWDKDRKGNSGGAKTQYSYRNQCAIWAIKSYISRKYKKKQQDESKVLSLDFDLSGSDDVSLKNIVPATNSDPLDILIYNEEQENLKHNLDTLMQSGILSERQSEYLKLYFFEDMTLEQIGKIFNITREAVRQGINKAYESIRDLI
jgi:RNA polymerase sigma factor (sigma-70 family)